MNVCWRIECQTTAGCQHRGPHGEMCWWPMTIPTQAQIEAAASAIRIRLFEAGIDPVEGLAKAALTAAAEVSVPEQEHIPQKPGQQPGLLPSGNIAAEVGVSVEQAEILTAAERDGIIEQCVQTALWFSNVEKFTAEDVAARIRALKSRP